MLVAVVASVSLPLGAAHGQQDEEVRILSAAGRFIRDSLPSGPLVFHATRFSGPGTLSAAVADRVAADIGAARGRAAELTQCVARQPGRRRACTLRGGAVVLGFARPVVQADTATVSALTTYQFRPGHLFTFSAELTLVRTPAGDWRVHEMRETGAS